MLDSLFHPHGLQVADVGLAVMRISLGSFFAISGYHKLFNRERHASLTETLRADKIPLLGFNQWFVPAIEFGAGIALALGLFTLPAALLLGVICFVACAVDGLKRIPAWKPLDRADYLDDVLYLPETLYGVMLVALILGGPGAFALDPLIHSLLTATV